MQGMGEKFDVLVIGGGLAGLSCACELADAGLKVLVLERGQYLGGRASSFHHKGLELDVGQHVFLGCCSEYQCFLKEIGAWRKIHLQPYFHLAVWRAGRAGILKSAKFPTPLHLLPSLLMFSHLGLSDKLRLLYGSLCVLREDRNSLEGETFYAWLKRHSQSEEAISNFWNLIVLPALNADVKEVDASWGLMVFQEALLKARGANIGYGLIGLSRLLDGVFPYLEGRGGRVILGKAAKSLLIEDGRVQCVCLANGEALSADYYVSAVPPEALLRLLPSAWQAHPFFAKARNLRWAPIVNVHLFYDREVIEQAFVAFLGSPVQWLFNLSKMKGSGPGGHLCLSLSGAWDYIDKDPKGLIRSFSEELMRLLPEAHHARLLDGFVIKMRSATFLPEPVSEQYRLPQRTPIENLFLAGDWTRTDWPATMEGAVRSGKLCAREILKDGSYAKYSGASRGRSCAGEGGAQAPSGGRKDQGGRGGRGWL